MWTSPSASGSSSRPGPQLICLHTCGHMKSSFLDQHTSRHDDAPVSSAPPPPTLAVLVGNTLNRVKGHQSPSSHDPAALWRARRRFGLNLKVQRNI